MIKAVVYDLDGTLLDTLGTIAGYGNTAMKKFGLSEFDTDSYRYFVGNGAKTLIKRMLEAGNIDADEYFDKVYEYYTSIYDADPISDTKPYDGIPELTDELRTLGIKQAILSNKPDFATKGVAKRFFDGMFDRVYGGREGIELKPHPGALLSVLDELEVKPDECVFVGDTYVDIRTGKSAGAHTIGVLWGFRDREELEREGAEYIVSKPSEIAEIVKSIK